jgi:hypothetical protein
MEWMREIEMRRRRRQCWMAPTLTTSLENSDANANAEEQGKMKASTSERKKRELLGWDGGSRRLLGRVRACCPIRRTRLGNAESAEDASEPGFRVTGWAPVRAGWLASKGRELRECEDNGEEGQQCECGEESGDSFPCCGSSYFAWSARCLVQSSIGLTHAGSANGMDEGN